MKKWQKWKGQKINNKGASMVLTIVTVALLSLMVSILLTIALYAFRMRTTDLKGKSAFYTAETALDEIRTGLQMDVSEAFSEAYIETMQTSVASTISVRKGDFQKRYVQKLRSALSEATDENKYRLEYLAGFIKEPYDNSTELGAKLTTPTDANVIEIREQGLVLKDVQVTYSGEDKYESEIKTDILLKYPSIDFAQDGALMNFLNFALIANDKFEADSKTCSIMGSAYLGENGVDITQSHISLMGTEFAKENKVITNNALKLIRKATFDVEDMEVWAQDIVLDYSNFTVKDGEVYVSNDLVVNNSAGNKIEGGVTSMVKISGKYYGFGALDTVAGSKEVLRWKNPEIDEDIEANPAKYSSAILVNGGHTGLDLSGLKSLMIAGNAYVGASEKNTSLSVDNKNKDVPMGESLSIKSNQIAYMVPAACVAPGYGSGKKNPMTADEYQELLKELSNQKNKMVDYNTVVPEYNKTLGQLGVHNFRTVSYPMASSANMVYLFMEFDNEEAANNFFSSYAGVAKNASRIKEQLEINYTQYGVKVPNDIKGSNEFYYSGNIVVNEESKANVFLNQRADEAAKKVEQKTYQSNFFALGCKLNKSFDALSDSEKQKDVYDNLVKDMMSGKSDERIEDSKTRTFVTPGTSGKNCYAARVVNGNYDIDSVDVTAADAAGVSHNAKLAVVIAAGNVTVNTDFTGMIIAGGTITIGKDVNLSADPAMVTAALNAADTKGVRALNYLKGFPDLLVGGEDGDAAGGTDSVSISDLVSYQNWKKQ